MARSQKYPEFYTLSSTDFFFPLVDDPYRQGQIAASNVLSDLYAVGVKHIDSVLMALAISRKMTPAERSIVTFEIIKGFNDQCHLAGTIVSGGQTILNPWPIIGGTAISLLKKQDFLTPTKIVKGDVILLTKPLGTQIASNAYQWLIESSPNLHHAKLSSSQIHRLYKVAMASMIRLNKTAAKLMHKHKAKAATDITGFGLLGHLNSLCNRQDDAMDFEINCLPVIRDCLGVDAKFENVFNLCKGLSAETSGGLAVVMARGNATRYIKEIEEIEQWPCYIIGSVAERVGERNAARISSSVEWIEV